jgi:hypothetical protein
VTEASASGNAAAAGHCTAGKGRSRTMKIYGRYSGETLVNVARLKLLGIGKYAFETSLFGEKPYELNMNMPMFDTKADAHKWIEQTGKWKPISN